MFTQALYTLFIRLLITWLRLMAPFHPKYARTLAGRKGLLAAMQQKARQYPQSKWFWFHAASLGEFEQGRPLMEAIRQRWPHYRILLTFFSPSGYDVRKNYSGADAVFYLPFDLPGKARQFVKIWQPEAAFLIKYEYWFNHLEACFRQGVPVYGVSGLFRPGQLFFQPYGTYFRRKLQRFEHFFVQNPASKDLLANIGIRQASVAGDTRFDRVRQVAKNRPHLPEIEKLMQPGRLCLVVGSSWPEDIKLLSQALEGFSGQLQLIIAPHEVKEGHLQTIETTFSGQSTLRYSAIKATSPPPDLLLVDNYGMLLGLYALADVAYVGGAFSHGLHNTLEAAVYGCPVIFGNRYEKFEEAKGLVASGGGLPIEDDHQLRQVLEKLYQNPHFRQKTGEQAGRFVADNSGALSTILAELEGPLAPPATPTKKPKQPLP